MLLSLAMVRLLPCSVAHRIGAATESCYGHEIQHNNPENPPTFKQDCVGNCRYSFVLSAEVDINLTELTTNVSHFTCDSVYKCKS